MNPGAGFSTSNKARQRQPLVKPVGVTASEKYLDYLCQRSFLSLWSYPSIFRNKKSGKVGDGKELCDMLVVFGNHVLIFSDKNCLFPTTPDQELNWKRWHKRTIQESASQAWGAERWLRFNPTNVYLDRECITPFPLVIPFSDAATYHLIVVANGIDQVIKDRLGGSGSLMLNSSLGRTNDEDITGQLFTLGDLNPTRTFVHVFSQSTVEILLSTLDTISDFISYLDKKERLFRSKTIIATGEEELLAYYLTNINEFGEHDFFPHDEGFEAILFEEGGWEDFIRSPRRRQQIEANEISYLWDGLIERFSQHAMNATQYYTNHLQLSDTEVGLRFMAAEPRTRRRLIMKGLVEVFSNTPDDGMRVKVIKPSSPDITCWKHT